jgi:GDPmannose 4,6-dehydratase
VQGSTAIVLGCAGQDGSLLSQSLLNQGFRVIGVSRSGSPNLVTHQTLGIAGEVQIEEADICDFRAILELIDRYDPSEIYNLAAQSSVGLSFQQPAKTCESIVSGTVNLLEVARFAKFDGRMFFAGSSEIFGNTEQPADLSCPRNPVSPYAVAKDGSLNFVRVYRQAYGLKCVTGILFNHESPYRPASFVTRKIINGALQCRNDNSASLRLGDLSIARDWGWAEEYIDAIQLITRSSNLNDQVVCTGRMVKLEYFVERVFSALGINWRDKVVQDNSFCRPSDIRHSVGHPEPMAATLGWRATKDVDQVIDQLLERCLQS